MGTREEIRQRKDVDPNDIDDIVGLAAELQEASRGSGASVDTVKEVARELDVEPEFVDAAIAKLKDARDKTVLAEAKEAEVAKARWRRVLVLMGMLAVGVALIALVSAGVIGAMTLSGASSVDGAAQATAEAEAQLDVVLKRQEALAPQLVALAGGELQGIEELKRRSESAKTVDERIEVANALGTAMAEAFGRLPPPSDDATAQMRMNLQYELVGAQNRITAEERRYEEAIAKWRGAASGVRGRMAIAAGLAEAPPGS